ncbi:hypothetical protein GLYMA_13G030100v4, partial [Glycine max]
HLSHSRVPSSSPRLLRCDTERVEGAGGALTSSQYSYIVCALAPNNHKICTVAEIGLNDACRRESATLWLKRKGTGAAGRKQSKKAAKVPNKRKRPPSVFFIFMSEFREQFKKEHPNLLMISTFL